MTIQSDPNAEAILQNLLDQLTDAIWHQRPEDLRRLTTNPHTILTKETRSTFHHDASLDVAVATFSKAIHDLGTTDYQRRIIRAGFASADVIEGTYTSRFLKDDVPVYPAFDAHMIAVRQGDRFRMAEVRNYVEQDLWPGLTGSANPDHVVFDEASFAAFLDDISTAFETRDLGLWRSRLLLPFTLITKDGPVTLSDDDAVTQNFAHYIDAIGLMQVDTVSRTPVKFERSDMRTVLATYRTDLLSRGMRATQPYTSSALLHLTTDGWKMSSILNALGHHHWTGAAPLLNGEDP